MNTAVLALVAGISRMVAILLVIFSVLVFFVLKNYQNIVWITTAVVIAIAVISALIFKKAASELDVEIVELKAMRDELKRYSSRDAFLGKIQDSRMKKANQSVQPAVRAQMIKDLATSFDNIGMRCDSEIETALELLKVNGLKIEDLRW
jgi:hypothetical protein